MPIFWSLDLERMLIYQEIFLMEKCYSSLKYATIWSASCWQNITCDLIYIYYHNWPNSKRNHPFPWQFLLAFLHTYLSEVTCNYGQNLQRISLRILMLSAFLTTILKKKLKVILLQLFLFGIPVGKADRILQEFRSKSFRKLDGLS